MEYDAVNGDDHDDCDLVMIIRPSNLFFRNSNTAFCIISVT